ncbi:hypothetical protein MJL33_34400, partial [Salmonella enterica subsp. enterica serovar Kentucky]|nr:hypothetical protein [Salmonella enterica subsp. enterica serovar Kentucky]
MLASCFSTCYCAEQFCFYLMLVIYSFNSSKLVTVWAGWSTRWYGELFRDTAMMSAVGLSL